MRDSFASFRRPLAALTVPILVEQFFRSFMGSVNIFLLGQVSDNAVASVGVANQFISMGQMLLTLISTGAAVVVSQQIGAGEEAAAHRASLVAIVLETAIGLLLCPIVLLFPRGLLSLLHIQPELMDDAACYLAIVGASLLFQGVFSVLAVLFRCYGKPGTPVVAILLMNAVNLLCTLYAVYSPLPQGLSPVAVVALGYLLATFASLALLFLLLRRKLGFRYDFGTLTPFPFDQAKAILRIGVPPGVESLSYNLSQLVTTAMIVSLGAAALSAKTYLSSIVVYTYLGGMSFGQAAQILVAKLAGAGELDRVRAFANRNIFVNLSLNAGLALLIVAVRGPLLSLFTKDAQILALLGNMLCLDVLVQTGRAFSHCYTYALRGTGDVRFSMVTMLLSTWLMCVPVAYLLSLRLGLGLYGIWIAFALDEWLRGLLSMWRWQTGVWKRPFRLRQPSGQASSTTGGS